MQQLSNLLNELESKIAFSDKENLAVSQANVGWHIAHSLLTFNRIVAAMEQSKPADYKWKFNFVRLIVLTSGSIPRGRAKAPEIVRPQGDITPETIRQSLTIAHQNIKVLSALEPKANFTHPFFGMLDKKQSIKNIAIHTRHHLKIINDILR